MKIHGQDPVSFQDVKVTFFFNLYNLIHFLYTQAHTLILIYNLFPDYIIIQTENYICQIDELV